MTFNSDWPPIFIVGSPRSGTTLLAAMLAAHSRLRCGPETRFFRFLSQADPNLLLESWPEKAIDFLFSIVLIDPVPVHYGLSHEQLRSYLEKRAPSVPSVLESLTEQYLTREGAHRWVEKSPEHLMHVSTIREYYPESPIIRIIRDPRDTALSMVKWPSGPQNFVDALFFWRKYDEQSAEFFRVDNRCFTLHYEDLVLSPEKQLKQLCNFIGEDYEPAMMDTSRSAGRVVTEKETWKNLAHNPVDQSRAGVWKRELSVEQNRIAEGLIGDCLQTYGYELAENFKRSASVFPTIHALRQHPESMMSLVEDDVRFWRTVQEKNDWAQIYVGEPDSDRWLSNEKPERWWDTLRIIMRVLRGKIAGRCIYWIHDRHDSENAGQCGRVLTFVFQNIAEQLPAYAARPEMQLELLRKESNDL